MSKNLAIKIFIFITLWVICIFIPYSQVSGGEHSTDLNIENDEENAIRDTMGKDIDDVKKYDGPGKELSGEEASSTIGQAHNFFSESVLSFTDKLDYFWDDDRSIDEANKTSIRIRTDFDLDQGSGFDFVPSIRANIRLPKTKNKLHLFLDGDENDEDELESEINDNDENGKLFLRYYFYKSPWESLAADTGIRIRSSSVDWFGGLRGRIYRTYGKWGFRLRDKLRWFTDSKLTNETRLDIERVIYKDEFFIRFSTLGRWFQRKDGYFVEQNFQIFHRISEKIGVVLEWKTFGETRLEDFFKETRVRIRYRQNVLWKWLFVEVAPSIFWDEENDWDTKLGIRFRIEAHFGNLSKLKFF